MVGAKWSARSTLAFVHLTVVLNLAVVENWHCLWFLIIGVNFLLWRNSFCAAFIYYHIAVDNASVIASLIVVLHTLESVES